MKENMRAIMIAFIGIAAIISANAQEYTDTTGLIADIEAGIYEEYILAPASVQDTFHLARRINPKTSFILKAKDDLGFMPIVTGNVDDRPGNVFLVEGITGGADMDVQGIKFVGSIGEDKAISDGLFRIQAEGINITVKDCEFYDFQGYNTIAKVYNSGGDITLDNVLTVNTAGKIIQVNYKDDDDTPNYVPKMGDLTITNSSFIDNYKRIFFELGAGDVRIDPNDENIKQRFNAGAENVTLDHCTFFRHEGVNVMQGRSYYEFAGDMAAVEGTMTITNTIFSAMDENLNADSASQWIFDNNYYDFGLALEEGDIDDIDALYSPTNTITTAPVYADTANGAWDLTLQNEADILGSDETPIGDQRWWQGEWPLISVKDNLNDNIIAEIYAYSNTAVIKITDTRSASAMIFNITGQVIKQQNLNSEKTEIQLPQGLYIIRVYTKNGLTAGKVLITE